MIVKRQIVSCAAPLSLESGRELPAFELAYETYGKLDSDRSNAILICHGLTANAHAAGRYTDEADERPGWWDVAIGEGKPFDTHRFFVVCSNVIGGCAGSTGPSSLDPATGRPYALRFPVVTIGDMVSAQTRLADDLGIDRFYAVAGGCMGGFQVLEWMIRHPERLSKAICVGAAARTSTHSMALWEVIRQAVMLDPNFRNGDYYDHAPPQAGVDLGTRFGMLIWMDRRVMTERFGRRFVRGSEPAYTLDPEFEVQAFLRSIGSRATEKLDANTLIYLTRAMDYFDLSRGRLDLAQACQTVRARTLLASYRSDWRYPPEEADTLRQALEKNNVPVEHHVLESKFSHGAFLYDFGSLAGVITRFLDAGE